jgi:hypothetical protein
MAFVITVPPGYTVIAGKAQLKKVLRAAGAEVATRARAAIRAGDRKQASQPGEAPHSLSGQVARSFRVKPWRDGEGVTVRNVAVSAKGVPYFLFLETGAQGGGPGGARIGSHKKGQYTRRGKRILLPRPSLVPALDQVVSNGLGERVRDAVVSGLAFRRGAK